MPRPAATRNSFSAPTRRRTRGTPRRAPAAAPAAIRRRSRSSSTREVFEDAGALDRLEAFASFHGADFYGLPRNADTITLEREPWTVPAEYPFGGEARRAALRRRDAALARSPSRETRFARCVLTSQSEVSQTVAVRRRKAEAGRGKSGLRRAGCWVTPRRYKSSARAATKARNRATETSRPRSGQTAPGRVKRGNLHPEQHQVSGRLTLLAESAGRWLERRGNAAPRRMTAIGRVQRAP